jgi:DNA-binding response OmpR family regulator
VRLRRYLEPDPTRPVHLITVRGVGYRFVPEPAAP